ncbi:MAG: YraN family protein [Oscillospiraceae bacterium]|jgi:putative endonuclease|nr:YraN family protein [Oscillospiraceae bacterium]
MNSGKFGEELAAAFLSSKDCVILARNYRIREGEIDIIALSRGTIIFAEVKTRADASFSAAREAVTYAKQKRLRQTAGRWLEENADYAEQPASFDVIEVYTLSKPPGIRWLREAF